MTVIRPVGVPSVKLDVKRSGDSHQEVELLSASSDCHLVQLAHVLWAAGLKVLVGSRDC